MAIQRQKRNSFQSLSAGERSSCNQKRKGKMRAQWGIVNSGNDNLTWTAYQQVGQRSQKHEDQSTEQADGSWSKRNNTESNDPYQ